MELKRPQQSSLRINGRLLGQLRSSSSLSASTHHAISAKEPTTRQTPTHHQQLLIETPFLIVGAGPVGTTLSLLLSRLHVPHILVDRRPSIETIRDAPSQAHFLSNRSMEIFRSLGHIDNHIIQASPPLKHWRHTSYTTALNIQDRWSNLLCVQDHFESLRANDSSYIDPHSPSSVSHFPQNKLVPLLLEYASTHLLSADILQPSSVQQHDNNRQHSDEVQRFVSPHCHLLLGHEWAGGFAGRLGVESFLRSTTSEQTILCQSGFVIGTDGKRSSVRECLLETEGIRMESMGDVDDMVNVGFKSKELGLMLKEQNPGMLHMVINGKTLAVLIAYDLDEGRFAAQFPFFHEHQSFEKMFNERRTRQKLDALAGRKLTDVELTSVRPWRISHLLASRFRDVTTGRVLIAGDAAHIMPPSGGLGMNCGFADAYNLSWKLAHLYHFRRQNYSDSDCLIGSPVDMKGSRLLESYAAERYYAGHYEIQTAKENLRISKLFPTLLGLNYSWARSLSNQIVTAQKYVTRKTKLRLRPIRAIVDKSFDIAFRLSLKFVTFQKLIYPWWLFQQRRAESLTHEKRALLPVLSWGSDLAYAYRNSPLNPQVQNAIPYLRAPLDPTTYYPPTLYGCRIPHSYVLINQKLKQDDNDNDRSFKAHILSTVDLPSLKSPSCYFCLIVWDKAALRQIMHQLERTFHENWFSPTVTPTSEKDIAVAARSKLALEPSKPDGEREALASFLSKIFVVVWNAPRKEKVWDARSMLNEVNSTSVAGRVGVQETKEHFPNIGVTPLELSDDDRIELGKDWTNEEEAIWSENEGAEGKKTTEHEKGLIVGKDSLRENLWWQDDLDMRRIWSDSSVLENFKQSLRIERLNDAALLLRPDAHIATLCESTTNNESLEAFVIETLRLPLT